MALTQTFKLHSVVFNTDDEENPIVIGALQSGTLTNEAEVEKELVGTSPYPRLINVKARQSGLRFSTKMVRTAIQAIETPLPGKCIATTVNPGISIYLAKYACPSIVAGNVHLQYLIKAGVVVFESMSVDHDGDMVANMRIMAITDGTNDPVVKSGNQALPTVTGDDARYKMHTATIGGFATNGKTRIGIEFNPQITGKGADGVEFDELAVIDEVAPVINVDGLDPNWYQNVIGNYGGDALAHADSNFVFRKDNTPDATPEHIRMTLAGTGLVNNFFDGNGNQDTTTSLRLETIDDGSNTPLVFDEEYAIP